MLETVPIIRRATKRDLNAVTRLDATAFGHGWSHDTWATYLDHDAVTFLVAVEPDAEAVAGYACFRAVADEAELLRVAVATTSRRRGCARALLRAGRSRLRRRGVSTVYLEVRHDQAGAIALYRAEGFHVVGRRPGYYRDPVADALLMTTTPSCPEALPANRVRVDRL